MASPNLDGEIGWQYLSQFPRSPPSDNNHPDARYRRECKQQFYDSRIGMYLHSVSLERG